MTIKNTAINDYEKALSWEIFDKIYHRYDIINTILSAGILRSWRKKLVTAFPLTPNMVALDCATGTGEVIVSVMKNHHHSIQAYTGIDLSKNMMAIGQKRFKKMSYNNKVKFVHASATKIPYQDKTFNCVTMAFGIRNIVEYQTCLQDIYRVLADQGTVMIMEFSLPSVAPLRWLYLAYFRFVLPMIGGLLSGDKKAYSYLNKTVESFPYGEAFKKELEKVGFKVTMKPLTFGIATLYIGKK
tara:strand:+ start:4581 stop:5306 length:726 start_codon:yes stop_codon:yes gene_type:complete